MVHVYKVLLDYIKSHRWSCLFFFLFAIFWSFTLPYMSYLFGQIIDEIKNYQIEQVSYIKLVGVPLTLYISIHMLRSIGYYSNGLFALISIPTHKGKMINLLFSHLTKLSVDFFETNRSGNLTNKISNSCLSLEPVIISLCNLIIPQSLAILITGIMLSLVIPYFAVILWVWGIIIISFTYRAAKIGRKKATEFAKTSSDFNGHITDVISNIQSVIHHASFTYEKEKITENIKNIILKERDKSRHANFVMFIQFLAMNVLVATFLIGSIIGYQKNIVSIGDMVFVMTSVTAISGLACQLGNAFLDLTYNIGILKEGLSLLDNQPTVLVSDSAKAHEIHQGKIEMNTISFSYPNQSKIIDNLSLEISPSEKIGLVGRSGSGKTTIMKLIMRLYDIQDGSISIDGINIKSFEKSSLRQQISLVPQHLTLFHRTIADNISYGTDINDPKLIISASKKANIYEFILSLPDKFDTIIGEQGLKLSGGQRQRLLIARAILKDAPILLLDEATSALDSETEHKIQQALDVLMKGKTSIVIAHRLSTLKAMDRIVVLDHGKIVEQGPPQELLDNKGSFYQYWEQQQMSLDKTL